MDFAEGFPAAAPALAMLALAGWVFKLWIQDHARHVRERDALIAAYERRQQALEQSHAAEVQRVAVAHTREVAQLNEGHAREVQTWRRRLRDCEHAKDLDKRWYDHESDPDGHMDPAGGDDGG